MDLEGNKFKFDSLAHSLLIDPTSSIPTPFNVGIILSNIRLIHYTTTHVLFLINGNYITLSKLDIHVVWFLENQVPTNWANGVLHHMLNRKRKNNILPYAKLITKILHYSSYPFVEEEPMYVQIVIERKILVPTNTRNSTRVVTEDFLKRETSIKPLKNKNIVITTKFNFKSRLCVGKILATPHICCIQWESFS